MQSPWGMDPRELMLTAARAVAVYVLMLIVIRALGKRTVGNFSAFDLLVALNLVQVPYAECHERNSGKNNGQFQRQQHACPVGEPLFLGRSCVHFSSGGA